MKNPGRLNKELVKLILMNQLKDTASALSTFVLNGGSLTDNNFQKLLKCSEFDLGLNIKLNAEDKRFELQFVDLDNDESERAYEKAIDLSEDNVPHTPCVFEKIVVMLNQIDFITATYSIVQKNYEFKLEKIGEPFLNKVTFHAKDGQISGNNGETLDFFLMGNHRRLETLKSKYSQVTLTDKQLEAIKNMAWGAGITVHHKKRAIEAFEYCKNYTGADWKMGLLLRELHLIFGY